MNDLFIDIETYSEVDLKTAGVYKYVEHPSFEILLIAYAVDDNPVIILDLTDMDDISHFERQLKTCRLHAHNATFERIALSKHFNNELKDFHCTMVLAATCGLPLSLDAVSKALDLKAKKLDSGKALINFFTKPCKPTKSNGMRTRNLPFHDATKWEQFKTYCGVDVEAEQEIYYRLNYNAPTDTERALYLLDQEINDRGVGIDVELAANAVKIDEEYKARLTERVIALTGVNNPGSRAQLLEWLNEEMSEEISTLRKDDIPALLKATDCPAVTEVLKARQGLSKTSVKKYTAMLNMVCDDLRARGLLQYYGANRTGRWGGRGIQVQNLPQNHLDELDFARSLAKAGDLEGIETYYGNPSDVLSQLIRTAFVAKPDHTFAVADFAQIEARVIAGLAGEKWRLEAFANGEDIYKKSASAMFGIPVEGMSKDVRAKGKVAELACGFGGGKDAIKRMDRNGAILDKATRNSIIETVTSDFYTRDEISENFDLEDAINETLEEEYLIHADKIVQNWRKASPNIVKLWYRYDNAAKEAMRTGYPVPVKMPGATFGVIFRKEKDALTIELPSKRKLFYWNPKFTVNRFGGESIKFQGLNQETKQWGWVETYGGKLTENIVQATARDLMGLALLRVSEKGFPVVMHIHDELVAEIPQEGAEDGLEQICAIMGQPVKWAPGLPLKAEGFISNYYKKDD